MKIITYCLDETITPIEHICIKSWLNNGYEVDLYTYSKNPTDLKVNIKNAEKLIKIEEINKILIKMSKKFFFKIKLMYILGGIVIDPDVYCIKYYNFEEESLVSCSPTPNYLDSYPDFSIMKFPKRCKEIQYIVHHFFMLYNDVINGYNTLFNINMILMKLVNKVFILNKKEWKFSNSCYEEHWKLQLKLPINIEKLKNFEGGKKDYIVDIKDLTYFVKIWQDWYIQYIPNFDIVNYKESLLAKLLREKSSK